MSSCCHSPLNVKNVSGLSLDYQFELIPDCPAATAAGYTAEDRSSAQVWYAPLIDEERFYYVAWHGGILDPTHKSGILICRLRSDGSLIFAVNCRDYGLDSAPNFLGDSAIIPRVRLLILDDTIYLCNGVMSNIGPELYAVNKYTGQLKYACAYYPPEGAGNFITQPGNYSQFSGSNMRLSDMCPVGSHIKKSCGGRTKYIFVGTSSLQNVFNVGTLSNASPLYTDQGFMFCVEDDGTGFFPVWRTPTCAPLIRVGDTLIQGGDPAYDPFPPGQDYVAILSKSTPTNLLSQPYPLPNPPAPGTPNTVPILAIVTFTKTTPINADLVQPIWSLPDLAIYEDSDRTNAHTLSDLLLQWQQEQDNMPDDATIKHNIWAYATLEQIELSQQNPANINLIYFKALLPGQTVTETFDAMSLNYWGNGTWGGPPTLDLKSNLIYWGSGQAHAIPLGENLLFSQPQYNFLDLKKPVIDTAERYVAGTATVDDVNRTKGVFLHQIQNIAFDLMLKSPRGQMSYTDGVLGSYIFSTRSQQAGALAFATRTIAWDAYTFVADSPELILYPFSNTIDGDVSSGVLLKAGDCSKYVTTAAKSGLSLTLDIINLRKNVVFDHTNLAETGVSVKLPVFNGPNGLLGGSNYLDADVDGKLVCSQGNMAWFGGSTGTNGALEFEVTPDGRVFDVNNSFVQAVDINTNKIVWSTPYDTRAHAQVVIHGHISFVGDGFGSYYALCSRDGRILWKFDAKPYGINGGILAPQVSDDGQVIWMNNYVAFGVIGQPGPNGVSLRVDPELLIRHCDTAETVLQGKTFVSWDTAPKLTFSNPAIAPVNNVKITHVWMDAETVEATHEIIDPPSSSTYTFNIKKFSSCKKLVTFKSLLGSPIVYQRLNLINKNTYELIYLDEGLESKAWMKLG